MFSRSIAVVRRDAVAVGQVAHTVLVTTRRWLGIVIHRSEQFLHLL